MEKVSTKHTRFWHKVACFFGFHKYDPSYINVLNDTEWVRQTPCIHCEHEKFEWVQKPLPEHWWIPTGEELDELLEDDV